MKRVRTAVHLNRSMAFLELVLIKERLNFSDDTLHTFESANLLVPFVELVEVRRDGPLVHGQYLLDLAVHDKVDNRELWSSQVLILMQLLVELDNNLLFELVEPDFKALLYLRVVLLRSRVRLEHSHDQASDELARVSTHLSVEVAADSGDSLLLSLVNEDALSFLTRGE